MSGENSDTSVDLTESRYRAKRSQTTLNIELGIVTKTSYSGGQGANSSVTGAVSGSPVIVENTGGGGGSGIPCPELSQWVLVQNDDGIKSMQVVSVRIGFYLWNPISSEFELITNDEIVDSPLIEVTDGWIAAVGSPSHPLIRNLKDTDGLALEEVKKGESAIACVSGQLKPTSITSTRDAGKGKVRRFETAGPGHIYAAGSTREEMFVFHNTKQNGNQ